MFHLRMSQYAGVVDFPTLALSRVKVTLPAPHSLRVALKFWERGRGDVLG
jgi:hypothetical protein